MVFKKRVGRNATEGHKALKMVKTLKKQVSPPEIKLATSTGSFSTNNLSSQTGSIVPLLNIPQGTTNITRIGQEVKLKNMQMRLALATNTSTVRCLIRFVIVQDKLQIPGSTPLISDVLNGDGPYVGWNPLNKNRFAILLDKFVNIDNQNVPQAAFTIKKAMNKTVKFTGTGATAMQKNGLYAFAISDKDIVTPASWPLVNFTTQFTYTDD